MKVVFVINNKGGRLNKVLPKITQHCEGTIQGEVSFFSTEYIRHATQLAREATDQGCNVLIAVGGDGTLNEVVNGILTSAVPAENYPVLGLLPHGSANDFARTAGIDQSVEALVDRINQNSHRRIDLGKIELPQKKEIRYFINISGVGLGPEVVQRLEGTNSVLGPGFNYFKHILKGFLGYRKKEVNCKTDHWEWQGPLLQMAVANGRYYGNGICTAPDALLDDGQFQVAIFGNLSVWDYLKNLGKLKNGLKIDHPEVHYFTGQEVHLSCKTPCGIEADGEFVGNLPARLAILPDAIDFLSPSPR
ncbi:MAG: diacylglycerol kinase family protein [Bacteroidota bacterium]